MLWVSALTYASDSTTTTSPCTVDMATVKTILEIGFSRYLLIGSDVNDFKKAIESVSNGW